ncbi:MAG: hypothetical protein NT144_02740, partial [Bacteroidia bacterium]|nr:hypothetical protein [Bacteroidia bacterium]
MKTTRNTSAGTPCKRRWQTGKRAFSAPSGIVFFIMILLGIIGGQRSFGQGVGISESSITPDPWAILELKSSLRGFLAPRMITSERTALGLKPPVAGMLVYDTEMKSFYYWEGEWKAVAATALGTAYQLLGMNGTGTANEYKTLNPITNLNISITHGLQSITINTTQDIHIGATPAFVGLKVSGLTGDRGVYTDNNSFLTTNPPITGVLGYWSRTGNVLTPTAAGDTITTSGNISTRAGGLITSSGLLTGSAGATITGGAVNLNTDNLTNGVNIASSTGNQTVNIANGAGNKTVNIGSTNGTTSITQRVGTGNFNLDGVGASTYKIGESTTGGSITIGGTAQTGAIGIGTGTGAQTLNFGSGGTGTKTINIGTGAAINAITIGNTDIGTTIKLPGLDVSAGVYTDASRNLTSAPPTSGIIGYWKRDNLLSLL